VKIHQKLGGAGRRCEESSETVKNGEEAQDFTQLHKKLGGDVKNLETPHNSENSVKKNGRS
jgi:hypothetical protein